MKHYALLVVLTAFCGTAIAGKDTCSKTGSDEACQEKAPGTLCARGDTAGVCAFSSRDHCKCVSSSREKKNKKDNKDKHDKQKKTESAEQPKCSWVGSHDGCREKPVGTSCSAEGFAGVCAISHWDRCECARGAPAGQSAETCSWVGSDSGCRDKPVGTVCSADGKAGICGITHWTQCKCLPISN